MGRFRTALATISVGAMLATGHVAQANGPTAITDEPASTSPQPGAGGVSPTTPTKPVTPKPGPGSPATKPAPGGNGGGGTVPAKPKPGKGSQQGKGQKPRPNAEAAKEIIPAAPPVSITVDPNLGLSGSSAPAPACDGSAGPPSSTVLTTGSGHSRGQPASASRVAATNLCNTPSGV